MCGAARHGGARRILERRLQHGRHHRSFGSTLIAGKLFGLDARQLTMAQGIVYSTAAGNREFTAAASWTKAFEAGWPGAGAITAVCLARQGYVGPATAYEGRFGLFEVYLKARPAAA